MNKLFDLSKEQEDKASDLNEKLMYIEANDSTNPVTDHFVWGLVRRFLFHERYVSHLMQGKVTALHTGQLCLFKDNFRTAINHIASFWENVVNRHPDKLLIATSAKDIERAKEEGKVALVMFLQSGTVIEDNLSLLSIFRKLDVRVMQLTYQARNFIGDGAAEKNDGGLSNFGVKVVERMNQLGMIIDTAHGSRKLFMEVLELSKDPVIHSHSAAYSLVPHVRTLTDEQIKALAEKDGVMGIIGKANYLRIKGADEGATIIDYLDHVGYVVELVGADHVGIGSDIAEERPREESERYAAHFPEVGWHKKDFDTFYWIKGMEKVATRKLNLIRGMISKGYSDKEIEKILATNWLRIYTKVWR